MINRVTNRRHGMKEGDILKVVNALIISRVAYSAPFLCLTATNIKTLNTALRKAIKMALGLPQWTSTQKLNELGISNTVEEILEAHRIGQFERLKTSHTGRETLKRLGYRVDDTMHATTHEIPDCISRALKVAPIPKNMNPTLHYGRRLDRCRNIERIYGNSSYTWYTDAAITSTGGIAAICAHNPIQQRTITASVRTSSPIEAEEAAIALAIISGQQASRMNIVSDSQNACRQWARGRIGKTAHRLAIGYKSNNPIKIIWAPGHETLEGNQQAHAWARASLPPADSPQAEFPVPVMPTYSEILSYYKATRIKFPHPHPKLQRQDQTALRSIQTNTFPHLSRLPKLYLPQVQPGSHPLP